MRGIYQILFEGSKEGPLRCRMNVLQSSWDLGSRGPWDPLLGKKSQTTRGCAWRSVIQMNVSPMSLRRENFHFVADSCPFYPILESLTPLTLLLIWTNQSCSLFILSFLHSTVSQPHSLVHSFPITPIPNLLCQLPLPSSYLYQITES